MLYHTVKLQSGIQLGYARFGMQGGLPVFHFHGLPGSAAEGELFHQACLRNQLELFSVDRFGYGQSDHVSGERFAMWAQSIAEFADSLHIERFYILAVSGGGPYALACASLLHERVIATGICCGLGPVANENLKQQMRPMATVSFSLALHHPLFLTSIIGTAVRIAAKFFSRKTIHLLGKINLPVDRAALMQPAANTIMQRTLTRAFMRGSRGAKADLLAAQENWPFPLTQVKNLQLWHGDADRVVPVTHSEWVQAHVQNAVLHRVKGAGHFSLPICHADEIIKNLLRNDS